VLWLIRRVFWFGTGASVGAGGVWWIRRRVRRVVMRYTPEAVGPEVRAQVAANLRRGRDDVRDAVREGRAAMRAREAELRSELAPPGRRG
jgi:hypothetical protein